MTTFSSLTSRRRQSFQPASPEKHERLLFFIQTRLIILTYQLDVITEHLVFRSLLRSNHCQSLFRAEPISREFDSLGRATSFAELTVHDLLWVEIFWALEQPDFHVRFIGRVQLNTRIGARLLDFGFAQLGVVVHVVGAILLQCAHHVGLRLG